MHTALFPQAFPLHSLISEEINKISLHYCVILEFSLKAFTNGYKRFKNGLISFLVTIKFLNFLPKFKEGQCDFASIIRTMTLNIRISSVSRRTQTFNSIRSSITMCILATQSSGAIRFLLHTTTMIRISTGTRIAHALRFLQRIFTVCVRATSRITDSWINRYQITKNILN